MRHLGHGQITELFAHAHQLVHDGFKLAHGLNLPPIDCEQFGITHAQRKGLGPLLAREQRIGAALNGGAVFAFDGQKLFGEGTPPELLQAGELLEELPPFVFQVGKIRRGSFHIIVVILQYKGENQRKSPKPTFISSTQV